MRVRLLALPATLSLLLAGCGGSEAGGGTGTIQLTAQNRQFSPQGFTAPAQGSISVTLKNADSVEHNFSVTELGFSKDVEGGETLTFTIDTKADASLVFFCKYHRQSDNMVGSLTVGNGGAPGSSGGGPSPAKSGGIYGY